MHTYMMNADELIFIYANVLVLLKTRVLSTLDMLYCTFTYVMNADELIFICTPKLLFLLGALSGRKM